MLIYAAIVAAIVMRFVIPRWQKNPPNRFIALIVQARGVNAGVPDAVWTRRDYLRAARLSALAAVGLGGLTWIAGTAGEHSVNGSPFNLVASGVLLIGAIGCVMAMVMLLAHLVRAAIAKPDSHSRGA